MALTMTQAHAVNVLADYLGVRDRLNNRPPPTHDEARDALATLAEHADKAMMAGVGRRDVEQQWVPGELPPIYRPSRPRRR